VIEIPDTKVKMSEVIMKLAGGGPFDGIMSLLQTPKY
jgi:hypothetical protein